MGCNTLSIGVWDYPSNSQIYYYNQVTAADAEKVLGYYRRYYPALPMTTQLISRFTVPGKGVINEGIVVWIRGRERVNLYTSDTMRVIPLDTMETLGARIVSVATAEIGYKESPIGSNNTKYGEWFGMNGVSWSAIFVSWVYDRAGQPLPPIGKGDRAFLLQT